MRTYLEIAVEIVMYTLYKTSLLGAYIFEIMEIDLPIGLFQKHFWVIGYQFKQMLWTFLFLRY